MLGNTANFGFEQEKLERKYPTPEEWNMGLRSTVRDCSRLQHESLGHVPWGKIAVELGKTIAVLEGSESGKVAQGRNPIFSMDFDLEKKGLDVQAKSTEWRDGYYDCLMTLGKALENVEDYVTDPKQDVTLHPAFIQSPTGDETEELPGKKFKAPDMVDCKRAFISATDVYFRIMTTDGLSTKQKVDAAIASADYATQKGELSSAENLYREALQFAAIGAAAPEAVDLKTGVIRSNALIVTPNITNASMALGTFLASHGNVASAMPIFLSILRASRDAPIAAPKPSTVRTKSAELYSFFSPMPRVPRSTGNETLKRTPVSYCNDSRVMNNVGEILFARGTSRDEHLAGIKWTRDGIEAADKIKEVSVGQVTRADRMRCLRCAEVGLTNLARMTNQMAEEAEKREEEEAKSGFVGRLLGSEKRRRRDAEERALWLAQKDSAWQERGKLLQERIMEDFARRSGQSKILLLGS